jgi:hypothetical protein
LTLTATWSLTATATATIPHEPSTDLLSRIVAMLTKLCR